MALGLSLFMLSCQPITTLNLANAFVATFKCDPRQGYAQGFQQILNEVVDGVDFLQRIQPHSNKGGGAMRALPCAYLATPEKVRDKALWQASLTHATKEGMESAAIVALLGFFCRQGVPLESLSSFIKDYLSIDLKPWDGKRVGNLGMEVARAAYTALITSDGSASKTLIQSVAYGGDTDTVAAIAMGLASLHPSFKSKWDLSRTLYDKIEDGAYGWPYLEEIDTALETTFPVPQFQIIAKPDSAALSQVLKMSIKRDLLEKKLDDFVLDEVLGLKL
jgi:hypothetical protein